MAIASDPARKPVGPCSSRLLALPMNTRRRASSSTATRIYRISGCLTWNCGWRLRGAEANARRAQPVRAISCGFWIWRDARRRRSESPKNRYLGSRQIQLLMIPWQPSNTTSPMIAGMRTSSGYWRTAQAASLSVLSSGPDRGKYPLVHAATKAGYDAAKSARFEHGEQRLKDRGDFRS